MVTELSVVRSEGGLLPTDLLQRIAAGDSELGGLAPQDYGLSATDRLGEAAARAWAKAKAYWAAFRAATSDLPATESGVTQTRQQWLLPLLRDLGYGEPEFRAAAEIVGERRYPISHRSGPVPLHLVSFRQKLEQAAPAPAGQRRMSPHALLQEYLNLTDATYGLVSNGLQLRLLRDNSSLTRQAYVQFDLEAMLDGGVYADFILLYLVLHRSRLPRDGAEASGCWLEKWRAQAESQGTRALGELRGGVEAAIEALGTGFLAHPANDALRAKLASGGLDEAGYYQQLLRLVYRLIFLFAAEERDLIFPTGANPTDKRRYYDHYSASQLRGVVAKYLTDDRHDDLWRGLRVTFDLVAGERTGLGVPTLNGGLFDRESCPDLDSALIRNDALAEAVRRLSWVRIGKVTRRVNYRDMGAEELGSVYEGLLERQPRITAGEFHSKFELVGSGQRKQTGSYYTPAPLVQELIRSALEPVIADRLAKAKTPEQQRAAILGITVCDPACGSGHFLLAAARRLARECARIEAGDAEPSPGQLRDALRKVIAHCLYGVDLNPLAVDLCKLALWLEGHDPGRPLGFLDHRIKLGNSLVGVFDLGVLKEGIPDGAYGPVTGDDRQAPAYYRKQNKAERESYGTLFSPPSLGGLASDFATLGGLEERTVADVRAKRDLYAELRTQGTTWWTYKVACDLWTAAFFSPLKQPEDGGLVPTSAVVAAALLHPQGFDQRLAAAALALSGEHRFFHWPLEFPEVFERGGFDCVLGNPPWERIKLQEQEFFADRDPEIASAPNKAARQKLIDALPSTPAGVKLYEAFQAAKRDAEGESKFVRESGRFPLTAVGDVNLYALFAEQDYAMVGDGGRAGVIVPTGIATDDSTKRFFQAVVSRSGLATLFDFENRKVYFPDIHASYKYSLLTLSGAPVERGDLAFFLTSTDQLRDERRRFQLAAEDFRLLNPNTRTCPVFRTRADADLTRAIYRRVPVLVDEKASADPWGIVIRRVFDMNNADVIELCLAASQQPDDTVVMYESKLVHQFDHRFASYAQGTAACLGGNPDTASTARPVETASELKLDPSFSVSGRYRMHTAVVQAATYRYWTKNWLLCWRDICRSTDERSVITAVLPFAATDFTLRVCFPQLVGERRCCLLLANLDSLVFDYVARQAIGGIHLSDYVTKQLPVLPPSAYTSADLDFIVPRVLELTYTAWDLKPFAEDVWRESGPELRGELLRRWSESHGQPAPVADVAYDALPLAPYRWDEDRRALLRAELDAYYAALYGLTRDELRYILDPADVYGPDFPGETFRVLKEREIREYGEYRTRRLVLEAWDRLGLAPRNRDGRYEVTSPPTPLPRGEGSLPTGKARGRGRRASAALGATASEWGEPQAELPGMPAPKQRGFGDL